MVSLQEARSDPLISDSCALLGSVQQKMAEKGFFLPRTAVAVSLTLV